jgi:hypothetical protein
MTLLAHCDPQLHFRVLGVKGQLSFLITDFDLNDLHHFAWL